MIEKLVISYRGDNSSVVGNEIKVEGLIKTVEHCSVDQFCEESHDCYKKPDSSHLGFFSRSRF
jgi:hypothetical protein